MNKRAVAYLAKYGVCQMINGASELMIPLERLQGFLDLLGPADVPPENLQKLYAFQATAVQIVRAQLAPWISASGETGSQEDSTGCTATE